MDKSPHIDRIEWEPENDKRGLKPAFDELVARNVDVHVERLDDGTFWMGIYPAGTIGGTGEVDRQVVIFHSRGKVFGRTDAE